MAQINPHMFREYDIRGVYGKELFDEDAALIGKAYGTFLKKLQETEVVVARDCRVSSPSLANALIAGLESTGCSGCGRRCGCGTCGRK